MTAVTENDLKRLEELIVGVANGQKAIENRLTSIESQLIANDNRLTALETNQLKLIEKVDGIDKRLTVIETRLEEWKPSIDKTIDLAEKVGELKYRILIAFLSLGAIAGWIALNSMKNHP